MQSYQDYLFSTGSSIIPVLNASITVYLHGTQSAASLFSDSAGSTPISNPLASNASGFFNFYAANGRYDLSISWQGQIATKNDIILFDPANGQAIVQVGGTIDNAIIGGTTPAAGHFTTLSATTALPVTSGGTGVTTSTGTGNTVLSTSPTLVTPALGTPASGVLTSCTGLPVSTGISGLGAGVATLLGGASSGTGAPIGGTSPTITNATLSGTVSGAAVTALMASPGPVGSTTASTGAFTTLAASGSVNGAGFTALHASPGPIGSTTPSTGAFTTLSASSTITPSQTSGIVGTNTNNSVNAGSVGEYVSATASAFSLTSNTPANATSISLTAGDWDVDGGMLIQAASALVSNAVGGTSTTTATLGAAGTYFQYQGTAVQAYSGAIPTTRYSLSATTTIFLVADAVFASGTTTASGVIRARRVR